MSDQVQATDGAEEVPALSRLRSMWVEAARRGEGLPGEQTLAEVLGVSRPRLREALVRLEEEGLIHRRHGAQTAVNRAALEISARFDRQSDFREILRDAGFVAQQDLIRAERVQLSDAEAATFDVAPGSEGMQVIKRWRADGVPAQVAIDLFPLTGDEPPFDVNDALFSLVAALRGEAVRWEVAVPGAVNADADMARWMEVEPGAALLTLECVGVTPSGIRAFTTCEHFRPHVVRQGFIRSVSS
jgi:GntR family transcriptional regulator